MLSHTLQTILVRDLTKLKEELNLYKHERNIWRTDQSITNSAGNLALHLVGNLKTYIGAVLGNTNYVRQRDLEFSLKDIPRTELITMIDETIAVINQVLGKFPSERFNEEYPLLVFKEKTSTEYFLVHLSAHLGYHLGQVNYHRRLLDFTS